MRKLAYSAIAIAAMTMMAMTIPASRALAQSAEPLKPEYNTAYCVSDASTGNGGQASLPVCTEDEYEQWYTQSSAYDGGGFEEIVNWGTGLCLQDDNNGPSGTTLTVWKCNNSESQAWYPGIYRSWVLGDGLCMDNGSHLVRAWTCNGSDSQSWVW